MARKASQGEISNNVYAGDSEFFEKMKIAYEEMSECAIPFDPEASGSWAGLTMDDYTIFVNSDHEFIRDEYNKLNMIRIDSVVYRGLLYMIAGGYDVSQVISEIGPETLDVLRSALGVDIAGLEEDPAQLKIVTETILSLFTGAFLISKGDEVMRTAWETIKSVFGLVIETDDVIDADSLADFVTDPESALNKLLRSIREETASPGIAYPPETVEVISESVLVAGYEELSESRKIGSLLNVIDEHVNQSDAFSIAMVDKALDVLMNLPKAASVFACSISARSIMSK